MPRRRVIKHTPLYLGPKKTAIEKNHFLSFALVIFRPLYGLIIWYGLWFKVQFTKKSTYFFIQKLRMNYIGNYAR